MTGTSPARMLICVEAGIGQNVKTKIVATFFSWVKTGCDRPFFRSYQRSAILVIFARSFLTQEELDPLYLFLFLSGHEKKPSGLFVFHKQTPPKNHFEPPPKGEEYPPYLMRGEY